MSEAITCFKAYDIRGRIPDQLNEDIAYRIARGYAEFLSPQRIVIGYDIRLSSEALTGAVTRGLTDSGVDVINIGRCGTEEVYFATCELNADGGVIVTASHNPMDYNGIKLVREQSRPISIDSGLKDIRELAERNRFTDAEVKGTVQSRTLHEEYVQHLLSFVDRDSLEPLKIVVNAGNGGAGPVVDLLEPHLPFRFVKVHHEPDGSFPNGVPNPLLPERRQATIDAIGESGADLGVAWDGDFDRCFLFDQNGRFIEGYYIVGLLAQSFMARKPGARVIYDPRLTWNTLQIAADNGGSAIQCKAGHAFIKECMRREDADYGGEMSAHHYFRDFFYCDSGMVPWLLVAELLCQSGKPLSELVDERIAAFPASGEINTEVADPRAVMARVEQAFADEVVAIDRTDGVSMEFADWRFNLRPSNTEPVLRLNVESRADIELMQTKTRLLLALIQA